MKRFILGIALFLGGIIGWAGWIIACMVIIQPGGVSSVASGLASSGMLVAALFLLLAAGGLVLAVYDMLTTKK